MILPDRDTIEKLLSGQLDAATARDLCLQLEDDAAFARVAAEIALDSSSTGLLRDDSPTHTRASDPQVDALIRRLRIYGIATEVGAPDPGDDRAPFASTATIGLLKKIGPFRILGKLGEGGMGKVYLAEDVTLGRKVALKVMRAEIESKGNSLDRFLREARAAAAIDDDHVVAILHVDTYEGSPYIVMPLLKGETLEDRLRREPMSPIGLLLKVGREVALGLMAADALDLIHRDIKPANLWLEGDPNSPDPAAKCRRTRILDFGLARTARGGVELTSDGAVVGSPLFMSPEQGRGQSVDRRSDLFSLGVVLYRMATGAQPFGGDSVMAVLTSLAVDVPTDPGELNLGLPVEMCDLIVKLLQKEPSRRYQSAREVVAAIDAVALGLSSGAIPAAPKPAPVSAFEPKVAAQTTVDFGLATVAPVPPVAPPIRTVVAVVERTKPPRPSRFRSPFGWGIMAWALFLGLVAYAIVVTPFDPKAGAEKAVEIAPGVSMTFCWVPSGRAQLGSPRAEQDYLVKKHFDGKRPDWLDRESDTARGKYSTRGFWVAKYPATQAEWKAVMGTSPSRFVGDRLPVERVDWYDGIEFCNAVAAKLGLPARYELTEVERNADGPISNATVVVNEKVQGVRLPSENEWEYATRGGAGNRRAYYWGDALNGDKANCDGNFPYGTATKKPERYLKRTTEVGEYAKVAPHPWGLCDMLGNVQQWCENPLADGSPAKAIRGGSWGQMARNCRSAFRGERVVGSRSDSVGFRVVLDP